MDHRSKAADSDENTALLDREPKTASLVSNSRLFLAVFSVVLGNFSFGYSMVYASPVQTALQSSEDPRLRMDSTQYAWFGAIYSLGAAAGGLGTMLLNDVIGRKMSIMTSAMPSAVGYMLMGGASDRWMLLLGRFLTGVAGGMTAASIPVYISEISHPAIRGAIGSCPQITAVCGALVLYALGTALPWRWLAVVGGVPAVLMVVLVAMMPSSPRRLLSLGRDQEAEEALRWLRGKNYHVHTELRTIQNSIRTQGGITWKELGTPMYYRPIIISVMMRFLQQLTGITPTLVYLQYILFTSKVALDPGIAAVVVGVVRLVSVAIAASLMDRAGRKVLLYTSSMLMILSSLALTMYSHLDGCAVPPSPPNGTHLAQPGLDYLGAAPVGLSLVPLFLVIVFIFGSRQSKMDTQSATLPPYILPTEGTTGSGVSVYHVHTPFTPPPLSQEEGVANKPASQVYTSGGGASGGTSPETGKQRFVSPDSDLGRTPGMTTCTSCQQQVMTNVTYKAGTYAWLMCLLFICCGLILCCCLIPFFLKNFKDAYHTCPRCNRVLHVEKKKCCSSA